MHAASLQIIARPKKVSNRILDSDDEDDDGEEAEVVKGTRGRASEARETVISSSEEDEEWVSEG